MSDPMDILLTLFNTLTKAFERTEKANENLVKQQGELVLHIKSLKLDEINQTLKDHNKESSTDIGTCTEEVKAVDGKISKMITVVITISSIFSLAVLIASIIVYFGAQKIKKEVEKPINPKVIEQIINKSIEDHEEREKYKFDEIKDEINKRHTEDQKTQ
jgi:hypothetical protein